MSTRIPTSTVTPIPNFISIPTSASLITIRVISYNILFGAGVDRQYDEILSSEYKNKNRLPEVLSFIKESKPDILGIQEANGWDRGDPLVVHQVAKQLNMNYYLAEAPNGFHIVLFTKFEIAATENLSGKEGDPVFETMRALRAILLISDGQSLNIFAVHLDPLSTRTRLCHLDALIEALEPYRVQTTILLGDLNFSVGSLEYTKLRRAGWELVAVATEVDQIWIPSAANWPNKPLSAFELPEKGLSDHLPVGAEISIGPTQADTSASASFPQFIPMTVFGCYPEN